MAAYSEIDCCVCGMIFTVPSVWDHARRRDHKKFWCPNGHGQSYQAESDVERERRLRSNALLQLDNMRAERDSAEARRRAEKAAKTRLKNRIHAGVCPHCNRHFENVARHMASKHGEERGRA